MSDEVKLSPIEAWAAIQKMKETVGWKLFLDRYAKKGDTYLTDILKPDLSDNGMKYTKRDLLAHQMETLGTLGEVLSDFEIDAKNAQDSNRVKKHVGN